MGRRGGMKFSFCKMYDKSTFFSGHVFSPFNASFTVVPILLFSQSPFLATTLYVSGASTF